MIQSLRNRIRRFRDSGPDIRPLLARYCSTGRGIEVGAGKTPYCSPANTEFLDRHTSNADAMESPDLVADGSAIPRPNDHYDFLLSSHCLEHVPNTIKTLKEWLRVLKPGGILFLVLPHGERTFDRLREKTTLAHHIRDYEEDVAAPDRSHIEEIERGWRPLVSPEDEAGHKARWGWDAWDWDQRFANDVVHYHVWTQDEIVRLLHYLGLTILYANELVSERHDSFAVIARKP
jgi:SAM-dependent methyltransferase